MSIKFVKKRNNFVFEEYQYLDIEANVPFGAEFYNGNLIVNLDLSNKNNEDINSVTEILIKEKQIINSLPDIVKENRQFISCVRNNKDISKYIRTYISKIKNEAVSVTKDLIRTRCRARLRFTSVWTTKTSYGVMINLVKLEKVQT